MKKEEGKYDFDSQDPIYLEEPGLAYLTSDPEEFETDDVRRGLKVLTEGVDGEKIKGDKTLEDYLALPEGTPIEMIDGVFYDRTSPTSIHARISMKISQAFENFIMQSHGKCIPFVAPVDVQLDCDDKTMVVPDLFVVCDRRKKLYPWVVGAPDLIVEVVSPSSRNMDVILKKHKYEKAGVKEYWIVFPEEKRIEVHFFEKKERKEYTFADKVPVGIWKGKCQIDFAEIYDGIRFLYEEMEKNQLCER